jgi:hypothetical protein
MLSARFSLLAAGVFATLAGTGSTARAQAWVDEKGAASMDLTYQFGRAQIVVVGPDAPVQDFDRAPTRTHTLSLSGEFVPVERLGITVDIPLVAIKYLRPELDHFPPGEWDDGDMHWSLQDLTAHARYQLPTEALAISPSIGFTVPLMDYAVNGFSAIGRHLKQLHLGAAIGRTLDPVAPNLYFGASYQFTLSERFDQTDSAQTAAFTEVIGQNRSDVEFEIGYLFLEGKLALNLAGNYRVTHGGINFTDFNTLPAEAVTWHDPLLAEEFLYLGGGATYAVTDAVSVALFARFFVRGFNTRDQDLYGLNVAYQLR